MGQNKLPTSQTNQHSDKKNNPVHLIPELIVDLKQTSIEINIFRIGINLI